MAVYRNSQHTLGRFLANDILVEARNNLAWAGDFGKQLLAGSTSLSLLVQDGLAELNTLAADVDVAWSFD